MQRFRSVVTVSGALCLMAGLTARAATAQAEEIPRGVAVPYVDHKGEPAFDSLRDDPSYAEVLAKIRAHPAR